MILYEHVLSSDCYKLRLMFGLLGMDYERRPVDMYPGHADQKPAFRALSPFGRLPVLQDGNLTIWDAQAALLYIAERGDASSSWTARSVEERANIQTWLQVAGGPLRAVAAARARNLFGDASSEDGLLDVITIIDDRIVEQEIHGSEWLVSDRPTIADVAVFPDIALHEDAGISLDAYCGLRRWLGAFASLPGFAPMPGVASM